jgi:hydrogenase maturation factor HypE
VAQNLSCASDELKMMLNAVEVDHLGRSVEYMLMVCNEKKVLKIVTGKKMFTKSR